MTLCDTCFLIDLLHGQEGAIDLVRHHQNLRVPTVAIAEFLAGVKRYNVKQYNLAIGFINKFEPVPFDNTTAMVFADLYHTMKDKGSSLSILDAMIASSAIQWDEKLITRDATLLNTPNLPCITY
jgi:predicted nucleic acid-binding protein